MPASVNHVPTEEPAKSVRMTRERTGEEAGFKITAVKAWDLPLIMSVYSCTVAPVHWALRAPLAKSTLTTVKTTTVKTEQPALMESTTTLVFVPPTTQVSEYNTTGFFFLQKT